LSKLRVGIYPGTFDPITNGHIDIIRRAAKIVDRLVVGVARNDTKGPLFSTDERVEIVRDDIAHLLDKEASRSAPASSSAACARFPTSSTSFR
jgi:pantetheine-phosphate adenylyltransferase